MMATNETRTMTTREQMERAAEQAAKNKCIKVVEDVASALRARGYEVATHGLEGERSGLFDSVGISSVGGVYVNMEARKERTGQSYTRNVTGKVRVTFGGYGNTNQRPEPKGGHSATKLADDLVEYVEGKRAQVDIEAARTARRKATEAVAQRLNEEFGVPEHSVGARCKANDWGGIYVELSKNITEDQARALLNCAREIGLLK